MCKNKVLKVTLVKNGGQESEPSDSYGGPSFRARSVALSKWAFRPRQWAYEGQASPGQGAAAGFGLDLAKPLGRSDLSSGAVSSGASCPPGSGGLLPAPPSAFSLSASCSVFLTALTTHWHGFWPVYVSPCYLWNVNSTRTEAIRELWFPVASCGARHGAWPIGRWSESPPRDSVTGWVSGSVRAFLSLGPTVSRPGAGSRSFPSRRIQRDYMSFLSLP